MLARIVAPRFARLVGDVLRGADHPLDDRIDRFEVTRVWRQDHRDLDHHPVLTPQQPRAEVVLDVARPVVAGVGRGLRGGAELVPFEGDDDRGVRFAEDVGHHVEAAAVGHADDDLAGAVAGGGVDDRIEHRNEHVVPLDRESLGAEIGLMEELLERFDVGQPLEQIALRGMFERLSEASGLDRLGQPEALGRDVDVVEVETDRPGVDFPQTGQSLRPRSPRLPPAVRRRHWPGGVPDRSRRCRASPGRARARPAAVLPSGSICAARWPYSRIPLASEAAPTILAMSAALDGPATATVRTAGSATAVAPFALAKPFVTGRVGVKSAKKVAKIGIDGVGIFQVAIVQIQDIAGIGAGKERVGRSSSPYLFSGTPTSPVVAGEPVASSLVPRVASARRASARFGGQQPPARGLHAAAA